MSAGKFHRNHAQHISISEKLSEEHKKTGQDILSQVKDLDQKLSDEVLIKVINLIIGGIYGVIPDLQEIIVKSSSEHENNADLKVMLKKLSQYCNDMVQECNSDSTTLKTKFETFIKNILVDTDCLLNIIKKDNLHDFKHELVESLKEILCSVHLGQIRMQIENCSEEEIKSLAEKARKEYYENISILEKCNLEALNTIAVNFKYNARFCSKLAYYYNKMASNYDDIEIQRKLIAAGFSVSSEAANALSMNEKFTNPNEAVNVLRRWCIEGWNTANELLQFNSICFENKKMSENLNEAWKMAVSYGILITNNLGSCINHDGLFALLE